MGRCACLSQSFLCSFNLIPGYSPHFGDNCATIRIECNDEEIDVEITWRGVAD